MKLQTKILVSSQENQIDYSSRVLMMGSCFVENIGAKLDYYKFQTLLNPFGILFHPLAIENLIVRAINTNFFTEADVFFKNEKWHCFEMHSKISTSDKVVFLDTINSRLVGLKDYLEQATHIVFTYGTSWVYRFKETQEVVANCYKIPQQNFTKELLTVEEITTSIKNTILLIKSINPEVTIITTVSPVRHLKDGCIENTVSKAHLLSSIYAIAKGKRSLNGVNMFPSYEIMMDELRDYRFYEEDMIHPSNVAISIIWERFSKAWISSKTEKLQKEIEAIQRELAHRPFNPKSQSYLLFKEKLTTKINRLKKKLPHVDFL